MGNLGYFTWIAIPNRASLNLYLGLSRCDLPQDNAGDGAEFERIPSARASYQKLGNCDLKVSRRVTCGKGQGRVFAQISAYHSFSYTRGRSHWTPFLLLNWVVGMQQPATGDRDRLCQVGSGASGYSIGIRRETELYLESLASSKIWDHFCIFRWIFLIKVILS